MRSPGRGACRWARKSDRTAAASTSACGRPGGSGARPGPRRWPGGGEARPDGGGVASRVGAPGRRGVEVVFEDRGAPPLALAQDEDGYFTALAPGARAGMRYKLRLDGGDAFPDPASR